jgi:FkbM family methyltransferase
MDSRPLLDNAHLRIKQCRHGAMLYLLNDQYIGQSLDRYGEFSEGEADLFRQAVQPGATIVEVGANLGAHTVYLAKVAGPGGTLHAFEPQRVIFQILCANVAMNALTNVHTYQAGVGRQPGTIVVPRLDYTAGNNFGGLSLQNGGEGERVPLMTVDSLGLSRCDFIKVDVEGMEAEVIAGATQTIRQFRPVLYVENDREEKSAALIQQIMDLGYRLYWHLPPLFNPQNYFGAAENIFGRIVSINMLAVHASIPQNLTGFRQITSPQDNWRKPVSV